VGVCRTYSGGGYLFLGFPGKRCRTFEKKIASIKNKKRTLRLLSGSLYLICFFGQTAQLVGMSAATLDFAIDIS